jgi:branched-chain amino acid transport system substrate-binding protein
VIGGTPLISSAILNAAPEIPIVAPATFYATMKTPRAEKFVAQLQPLLRQTSGLPKDIEPSMYDANIYEIVSMYIEAAKKDGLTGDPAKLEEERTKIRDYMTNLKDFEGFSGKIHFAETGDAAKNFFIVQGQNGAWTTKVTGCSAAGGC